MLLSAIFTRDVINFRPRNVRNILKNESAMISEVILAWKWLTTHFFSFTFFFLIEKLKIWNSLWIINDVRIFEGRKSEIEMASQNDVMT